MHLELATDLTAESSPNAYRKFVARKSCPKPIYSDNATNFQLGSEVIHQILEGEEFQEELTQSGVRRDSYHQGLHGLGSSMKDK